MVGNQTESDHHALVKYFLLLSYLLTMLFARATVTKEWFVRQADPAASDASDGSESHPLRTINAAAQLAQPGDVITVGAGIYHEWISPARGGDVKTPIRYRSLPEHVAIVRGTDVLSAQWQPDTNSPVIFRATLTQSTFVFGNPFSGPPGKKRNALVFYQDRQLSQAITRDQLIQTKDSWLASDDGQQLFVHLQNDNSPAARTIEITTRDRIFAPHRRGLGYIEVEGFIFERCATSPDWPQLGAVSTRTGHHWVIRNNIVRQTTGKGIDCGSETWDAASLTATEAEDKHVLIGGNHLIEGNVVTDNAQCGIAAWNTDDVRILGNIVRNNGSSASADNRSLTDFEAAGIKVHAFRHGLIEGNLVLSNASFGIWLDNGWENARVTRNVAAENRGAGIFVELGFGPMIVDHNLSAANRSLGKPYFGDGIYTHDASGVAILHNTFLENAHYGIEQLIVSERVYWPKRLAEASNEAISGNFFCGNSDGAISLPLTSPRAHDNASDHNVIESGEKFIINDNNGRIPVSMILREARDRVKAADLHEKTDLPDLSDAKHVPKFSLPAWQAIMQMDANSTLLPAKSLMHFDSDENLLHVDLPSMKVIPTIPKDASDDFDLLGQPIKPGNAHAGAIENLRNGTLKIWPLQLVTR